MKSTTGKATKKPTQRRLQPESKERKSFSGNHPTPGQISYDTAGLPGKIKLRMIMVEYLTGCFILWAFYQTPFVLAGGTLYTVLTYKPALKLANEERLRRINSQFKVGLQGIAGALGTGYSLENAINNACNELKLLFGEESELCCEFQYMISQIALGRRAEDLFQHFGRRSGLEDIMNFAEILTIVKRSGGDLVALAKTAAERIQERIRIREEIQVLVAGKRLEQAIMVWVLPGLLIYLNLTSPEFLSVLYHTTGGRLFMTGALAVYLAMRNWGERISNIRI